MKGKVVHILLIEDDPDDTLLIKDLIEEASEGSLRFKLECADSLMSGLDLLVQQKMDVLLLDLMLPDSRGLDALKKVRRQSPNLPVVILTGLSDEESALEAVRQGAQDYLVKGAVDPRLLRRVLSYAIERGRLRAELETLLRNSADGMVVVDEEGLVRYLNRAAEEIFERKAEEMLSRPFEFPCRSGKAKEFPFSPAGKGGEEKIIEIRATALEWNEARAHLAVVRDVTEHKKVEKIKTEIKERRMMDQLKDEFMAKVSHQLKSPLSVIKSVLGSLEESLKSSLSEPQSKMFELADSSTDYLTAFVNKVLDLTQIELGITRMRPRRMNAAGLLRDAVKGFQFLGHKRGIEVTADFPAALPEIYADEEMLMQVLTNLLENALRFARRKVSVRAAVIEADVAKEARWKPLGDGYGISLVKAPAKIQFSVEDDGPGIPKEKIKFLFQKFVQVHSSEENQEHKGTGLGLAICKEIVQRHQGEIWAESPEGRGALFCFTLPLKSSPS